MVDVAEEARDKFAQELRELTFKMSREETVGILSAIELLKSEISYAEGLAVNAYTTENLFESWMENIRDNLGLINYHRNQDLRKDMRIKNSCIAVGAGPSLNGTAIDLDGYKGTVICVNKIFRRMTKYRIPDLLCILHTTNEILPHFQDIRVPKETKVLMSTCVTPQVAKQVLTIAPSDNVYWFNASTPDTLGGMDKMVHVLTKKKLQTLDTGGNVGIFAMVMGKELGAKTIGMLGLEHCTDPSPSWSVQQALSYSHIYSPEQDRFVTVTPMFKGYLNTIINWAKSIRPDCQLVNLTKKGLIYIDRERIGIPYMHVKEFVKQYD